jgi:hypothetical protein
MMCEADGGRPSYLSLRFSVLSMTAIQRRVKKKREKKSVSRSALRSSREGSHDFSVSFESH